MRYPLLSAGALLALIGVGVAAAYPVWGAVMESASYRIQSDSINFGGRPSSSSSWALRDTLGEVATGVSTSSAYALHAGYQQMQEIYLAMSAPSDVALAPALGGVAGGESNGTTTVVVTTDNPAGYTLQISFAQSPALQRAGGGGAIDDYPAQGSADPTFVVPPQKAVFGYTVDGPDTASTFLFDGVACGGGSDVSAACWVGPSLTSRTIAFRPRPNHPAGTPTTLHFRVGVAQDAMTPSGLYHATTTLTLLPR